jgi:hypothetical protein
MTWLLFVFGMAGPALVGEYPDEAACDKAAHALIAMLKEEHKGDYKYKTPAMACVGLQDAVTGPSDGKRI